jgi:hypothetical protein
MKAWERVTWHFPSCFTEQENVSALKLSWKANKISLWARTAVYLFYWKFVRLRRKESEIRNYSPPQSQTAYWTVPRNNTTIWEISTLTAASRLWPSGVWRRAVCQLWTFGGTCCLHLLSTRKVEAASSHKSWYSAHLRSYILSLSHSCITCSSNLTTNQNFQHMWNIFRHGPHLISNVPAFCISIGRYT